MYDDGARQQRPQPNADIGVPDFDHRTILGPPGIRKRRAVDQNGRRRQDIHLEIPVDPELPAGRVADGRLDSGLVAAEIPEREKQDAEDDYRAEHDTEYFQKIFHYRFF